MTDLFNKAIKQVLKNEGGYSNKSSDNGGATKYGITEKVARENGYKGDMLYLPENNAKTIYYNQYWIKSGADKVATISFNIAFLLFDFGVNSGVKNAVKKLQTAINKVSGSNLIIDGIIGKKTIHAIEKYTNNEYYHFYINKLEKIYIAEILKYYTSLKNINTGFQANGAGWVKRVANNINFLNGL